MLLGSLAVPTNIANLCLEALDASCCLMEFSAAFPFVNAKDVLHVVELSCTTRLAAWVKAVNEWIGAKRGSGKLGA